MKNKGITPENIRLFIKEMKKMYGIIRYTHTHTYPPIYTCTHARVHSHTREINLNEYYYFYHYILQANILWIICCQNYNFKTIFKEWNLYIKTLMDHREDILRLKDIFQSIPTDIGFYMSVFAGKSTRTCIVYRWSRENNSNTSAWMFPYVG